MSTRAQRYNKKMHKIFETAKRLKAERDHAIKPTFYRCGICECFHSITFNGDCRQDDARFAADQLDEKYGSHGWQEEEMPVEF